MNEEQDVLNFFANEENLPLALSVAEQVDNLRREMNNRLWRDLQHRIDVLVRENNLAWQVDLTEDRNSPDVLVGLHCNIRPEQGIYLRPMAEQQYLGREWRIYYGLMWSSTPSPEHLGLSTVTNLKESLLHVGFSNNSSFLAWQWSPYHPGRREFLLRYTSKPETILGEMGSYFEKLLIAHGNAILEANLALRSAPRSMPISLTHLQSKLSSAQKGQI